jgi:hypothetical protein
LKNASPFRSLAIAAALAAGVALASAAAAQQPAEPQQPADPSNIGPNGKPRLNFADDSKPQKATARLMVRMVQEINAQYIGKIETKIDASGEGVKCGTCHRGHLNPEPYVPAPDNDHDHPAAAAPTPSSP